MNLREGSLLLVSSISRDKVEELFKKNSIAVKYSKIIESQEFKKELEGVVEKLRRRANKLTAKYPSNRDIKKSIEEMTSPDLIMENLKLNSLVEAISTDIEKVIFDRQPVGELVETNITLELVVRVLYMLEYAIGQEIEKDLNTRHTNQVFFNATGGFLSWRGVEIKLQRKTYITRLLFCIICLPLYIILKYNIKIFKN